MNKRDVNYIDKTSANGDYTVHIDKSTADRIKRYCKNKKMNKAVFVRDCINKQLDELEKDFFESLSKEELIAIILEGK